MKKKRLYMLLLVMTLLCTSCQPPEEEKQKLNSKEEIKIVLETVEYKNLDILFDEIKYYDEQNLEVVKIEWYNENEHRTPQETIELYADVVFPALMDAEVLDKAYLWDLGSVVHEGDTKYYEVSYQQMLDTIETYEKFPDLIYANDDEKTRIYSSNNWFSGVYISQGVLGQYAEKNSPFSALNMIEEEKTYDTRYDDLSDSYMLMDGEKTVAQAKDEIEAYFNAHYPIAGRENGIENMVHSISVGKIVGTDYYAFSADRTFSYNGIPFSEMPPGNDMREYFAIIAECAMCESNKVDVTIGLINGYTEPEVVRAIESPISFQEVMDRVAYYLTEETKFELIYGGLEYRMMDREGNDSYELTPAWCFFARNPNDSKMLKLYVDMETGETTSYYY